MSLMDESGNTKDDLKLPTGTDDADKLAVLLQEEFDSGKELTVTVLKARGSPARCCAVRRNRLLRCAPTCRPPSCVHSCSLAQGQGWGAPYPIASPQRHG